MTATHHLPTTAEHKIPVSLAVIALSASLLGAETPKFHICTGNGLPMEEQRKEQMLRLASEYDLKKYTITRDIIIERGAINHSSPALTLGLRFLDNDDLALSTHVHEQGHWLLMERRNLGGAENPRRFEDLQHTFPGLDYQVPEGDGKLQSSYFHIAVCMLEWQAMEELSRRGTRSPSDGMEAARPLQSHSCSHPGATGAARECIESKWSSMVSAKRSSYDFEERCRNAPTFVKF